MRYFRAVRLYSAAEVLVFTALITVAVGGWSEEAKAALGWTHGVGWIALCVAVYEGCRRRVFPWPLLAATVSPLGPVGSTAGIEWLAWRRRRVKGARAAPEGPEPTGGEPRRRQLA